MNLQQALTTSDYSTAEIEYNGIYTCVDGSSDGYDISTGVQGMPAREHQHVGSLEEAIATIKAMELDTDSWMPIGEDGASQE